MKKIKILYVLGGVMSTGGIESHVMNYYREIDKNKYIIDFLVHGNKEGIFDEEIRSFGGKIYNVPIKSENFRGNIIEIHKILRNNKYDIIHTHMDAMNLIPLIIAKINNVKVRISHSHNTNHLTNSKIKYSINELARKLAVLFATHYAACSSDAGKWLFGNKKIKQVKIIKNAINLDSYKFNLEKRENKRKELKVSNSLVIGHIGRFDYQKNHDFLLDIFSEIVKLKNDSHLILVGSGHLEKKINSKIQSLNLQNKVSLVGSKTCVTEMLNAMDVFLFPSLFEGLGMVLIEAQANGLPAIISDTIPQEVIMDSERIEMLSLEGNHQQWAMKVISFSEKGRSDILNTLTREGYSIENETKQLEDYYYNLYKGLL